MTEMNDKEKLDFVINELAKLKAYFEGQTRLIEEYIKEVKSNIN